MAPSFLRAHPEAYSERMQRGRKESSFPLPTHSPTSSAPAKERETVLQREEKKKEKEPVDGSSLRGFPFEFLVRFQIGWKG